jgi:hypothetical protein
MGDGDMILYKYRSTKFRERINLSLFNGVDSVAAIGMNGDREDVALVESGPCKESLIPTPAAWIKQIMTQRVLVVSPVGG